jgi:cell division protein FtsI (penicillin-binding protein 3)
MPAKPNIDKKIIVCYSIVAVVLIVVAGLIFGKACLTSINEGEAWRAIGAKNIHPNVEVPAMRGNIYAANGELMATTESRYRLFIDFYAEGINPDTLMRYVKPLSVELNKLLPQKSAAEYEKHLLKGWKLRSPKNREYRLLSQDINYLQWKAVKKMPYFNKGINKSGLYSKEFVKRTKPYGSLASRTIGDIYGEVDTLGRVGKNGLEMYYDESLKGFPGTSTRKKVAGQWINVIDEKPVNGKDIISTIDINMQDFTEKTLRNKLRDLDAELGMAVVMETATGEVKAITNLQRMSEGVYIESKNYAVSDLIEPGSTFKVVSMVVALEDGLVTPNEPVDVGNGTWTIPGTHSGITDHNANRGGYGMITAAKTIRYSSNIGVAKLIMKHYGTNPGKYVDGIYKLGFYKDMHLEIPGAASPVIRHPKDSGKGKFYWSNSTLASMSYGYATQMPPIYTLSFFNAIANNGTLVKPMFVREIQKNGRTIDKKKPTIINEKICSDNTLHEIRVMLDSVVNAHDGTGKPARSEKFSISGKTGTARIASKGVYSGHQVSFCGFFPSDNPQYSMIVVIRQPRIGNASGGLMCGTVFKSIAEEIYAKNIEPKLAKTLVADTLHPLTPVYKRTLKNVEISAGKIPNVTGMGAKDALFALESVGAKVQIVGKGKIIAQSIVPGATVNKGQTVVLQLK